ncbi:hypothetical protein SF06_23950 [Pseudomonas flexibilis]|uniref:Uncharacterized protein n=1 Tax=Pseudomonas flexibilis TaxID=706570 RepID=A0A1N7AE35_9PSED|nr:hypothetical protein [Pseudomonas flexibilis]KHL68814.1 hypothetical protein SF06_23950 [Pseudomonas flexibilis]SIR37253.1 hypothetical protein SAMN05421672_12116 [Pseudomonas flexibilis]
MAVSDLIQQARARFGQASSVLLRADQPTGEKPWEMFVTDEHTEHYLALKAGGDTDRGMITGVLGGSGVMLFVVVIFIAFFAQRWDLVPSMLWICIPMLLIPFYWETRRPLPLPILFNRRTREVYFDQDGLLFHTPWDGIQALAGEFLMVGPHTGGMRNASLEILVRRLGEPDNALLVSLGPPMGKTLQMQKGFWEWLRAYMDNGPWFDENGQRSDSDAYVKEMLSAHMKPTGFLAYQRQRIAEKKAANDGKNYLEWTDTVLYLGHLLFYPMDWLQEFTYNVAKRRSRNRWPRIVTERLQSDGPTTRLIDLERERGLDV